MTDEQIDLTFATRFRSPDSGSIDGEYNEYGVKEVRNDSDELERVEFIFEAMQPGSPEDRNGFDITPEFIQKVTEKNYSSEIPFQMSHSKDQRSNAGFIDDVWNEGEPMFLHGYVPNTGNELRSDVIADLTHEPPALRDGSVGFGSSYDYEITDKGFIRPTDGELVEFSATPFPGGYDRDSGGLKAQFVKAAVEAGVFDDEPGDSVSGSEDAPAFSVKTILVNGNIMKFNKIELEQDVSEMSDEDMKEIIAEFADKHEKNVEEFRELKAEFDETKEELDDHVSRLAGELSEEQELLTEDELMDFSLERLENMKESLESEPEPEPEGEGDDVMSEDKPSKAGDFSDDSMEDAKENGKSVVSGIPGLTVE